MPRRTISESSTRKSVADISQLIEKQLNIHLGTEFKAPRVAVIKDPQDFFYFYTNKKKKRSMTELIELDGEVDYFYDHNRGYVLFKGFRRNGEKSFKRINHQTMKAVELVHEFVHHWQVVSGGYGPYDLFEEGCDELVTFVITGDINQATVYWEFVRAVWGILDVESKDPIEKYEWAKAYVIAKDKALMVKGILEDFIEKRDLDYSPAKFVKDIENDQLDPIDKKIVFRLPTEVVVEQLYSLHDHFKKDGDILKFFD